MDPNITLGRRDGRRIHRSHGLNPAAAVLFLMLFVASGTSGGDCTLNLPSGPVITGGGDRDDGPGGGGGDGGTEDGNTDGDGGGEGGPIIVADDHIIGSSNAKVTVVSYECFQ